MKSSLVKITVSVLFVAMLAPAYAAKGDRKNQKAQSATYAAVLKKYDTNANGKIDGDEIVALRKAFDAGQDETLKALDTNSDGKLSDEEIAAVSAAPAKAKKKK